MARVVSFRVVVASGSSQARQLGGTRWKHTRWPGAGVELEVEAGGATTSVALRRRLEEAIDGAMARMSEPDWAPFRPGTSYYAPPRPVGAALGLLDLVTRGRRVGLLPRALSDEEVRAIANTSRGYPCSTYFIDGRFPDQVEGSRLNLNPAEEE